MDEEPSEYSFDEIEIGMQKIVEELKKLSDRHGAFYEPDPLLLSMC